MRLDAEYEGLRVVRQADIPAPIASLPEGEIEPAEALPVEE